MQFKIDRIAWLEKQKKTEKAHGDIGKQQEAFI